MTQNQDIQALAEDQESSIDWVELISVLWSSRKLIATVTGIATVGAVVVSLLLPEYYKSTATLLPETNNSKLAGLGGLSDLAALAGVNVGGEGSLAKLYPNIVKSESVLKNVIFANYETKKFNKPVNLVQYWEIEEETPERSYEVALESLRDELSVSLDNKTNVVTIEILTREPKLSADIVMNVVGQLDEFMRTKRTTNASEQRQWIEARLGEVQDDLEKSENALKEFREKNRRVSDSPQLLLEQARLMREVDINSTLYAELKKQFEIVKIEEIKNLPIINVMDEARPAAKKDRPRRSVILVVTLLLAVVSSSLFVITATSHREELRRISSVFQRNE
jgi:uncharacterized protein involved in exopolysaccharide biosynthesis